VDEVKVNKTAVLAALQENREKHRSIFEEAVEGFREKAQRELDAAIERVRSGSLQTVVVHLPRPVDHTKDYDREIKMLELSVDDEIVLSQSDFAAYVMDDWQWKREFITSNAGYSVTAAASLGDFER
jgi:hypothetical protein